MKLAEAVQSLTRVPSNAGLGWWAMRQCRGFSAFVLCFGFRLGRHRRLVYE